MNVWQLIAKCDTKELDSACIAALIATLTKEGGIKKNWREFVLHAMPILQYLLSRLWAQQDDAGPVNPHAGDGYVFMAANPIEQQMLGQVHDALRDCPECAVDVPMSGLLDKFLINRVIQMLLRGLQEILSDPDKVKELLDQLIDTIKGD